MLRRVFRRQRSEKNCSTPETEPWGLKTLATGNDPNIDIVAIHGLNGHREKTWSSNGHIWLRDFLPARIPKARIITWGYDANTHGRSEISKQLLYDHAINLITELSRERRVTDTERRPIIFIAHSLGGLVLKSALIHASSARPGHLEHHKAIFVSTHGILFAGTPHQGSEMVAWGQILAAVASIFVNTNTVILRHLEMGSDFLHAQLSQYLSISDQFVTMFAYETLPTRLPTGNDSLIVPRSSAVVPGTRDAEVIAIAKNHSDIVKVGSPEDANYRTLCDHLVLMAKDALSRVAVKWQIEQRTHIGNVQRAILNPQAESRQLVVSRDLCVGESGTSGSGDRSISNRKAGNLQLHHAAQHGADDLLEELLEGGADPDSKTTDERTPLHIAALKDSANTIQVLIRFGANINATDDNGKSPMIYAAVMGKESAVTELIKYPLLLELADNYNQTALFMAAHQGHTNVVRMLLNAGADIYHGRESRQTPLHASVSEGHVKTVREIVSRHIGNSDLLEAPGRKGERPLHLANVRGVLEVASILLDAGADIDSLADDGSTPLHKAVEGSNLEIAELLVLRGARTDLPASHGFTLLQLAKLAKNPSMVVFLRDKGIH